MGQLLKKFKDTEDFIENEGLSRRTTYFKSRAHKFFRKISSLEKLQHLLIILRITLKWEFFA